MAKIKYKSGFKYQLAEQYSIGLAVTPKSRIESDYISLMSTGALIIRQGYAWDGPSGPTYDSKNSLRASLVHDALYQLIRSGNLPQSYRIYADKEFYKICREDGMSWLRAKAWYLSVRGLAGSASEPKNVKKIKEAP